MIKNYWFKSTLIQKSILGGDIDASFDPFSVDDEIRVAQEEDDATRTSLMQSI
jgi:hypothetical protein